MYIFYEFVLNRSDNINIGANVMELKNDTVNPMGLKPEILLAMNIASIVYQIYGYSMRITSITDYKHSAVHSDHYKGYAFDVGTKELGSDKGRIIGEIKRRLNDQYRVLLEGEGTDLEHLHIGYKPTYQGR